MNKKVTQEDKFDRIQRSTWARTMEALFNIIVLNAAMILGSALGLVFFGLGPSMVAGYVLLNRRGLNLGPLVFKDFFTAYKENFFVANALFYINAIVLAFIIYCVLFYSILDSTFGTIGLYLNLVFLFIVIGVSLSVFYNYASMDEKSIIQAYRLSFYYMFLKPIHMFVLVVSLMAFSLLALLFPQFIMFFGLSTPIYITYYITKKGHEDIKNKVSELKSQGE